jgi:hypothetical protein
MTSALEVTAIDQGGERLAREIADLSTVATPDQPRVATERPSLAGLRPLRELEARAVTTEPPALGARQLPERDVIVVPIPCLHARDRQAPAA